MTKGRDGTNPQTRYLDGDRRDRLYPKRSHPRYRALTLLRQRLEGIINSSLLPPGEVMIDFGCGNMPYEPLFAKKFRRYLGVDLPGNEKADLTVGPDGRIPLEDDSVGCVFSSQVLEHVADPVAYLREAHRVLQPGGSLILSTHGIWRYHADPLDYWRWTTDGLEVTLAHAGFEALRWEGVLGLRSTAIQLWQDATERSVPRRLRTLYVRVLQMLIGFMERGHASLDPRNASILIVLGRKQKTNHGSPHGRDILR